MKITIYAQTDYSHDAKPAATVEWDGSPIGPFIDEATRKVAQRYPRGTLFGWDAIGIMAESYDDVELPWAVAERMARESQQHLEEMSRAAFLGEMYIAPGQTLMPR